MCLLLCQVPDLEVVVPGVSTRSTHGIFDDGMKEQRNESCISGWLGGLEASPL